MSDNSRAEALYPSSKIYKSGQAMLTIGPHIPGQGTTARVLYDAVQLGDIKISEGLPTLHVKMGTKW